MTQTNMISFKKTYANGNNSYNKPFTIRIGQIFICSLKTTLLIKIKHYLQKNSKLIRRKKTQDDGWSYCKQLQEMLVRTLPKTAVYQGQVNKGRVMPRHCYKERKDLLINDVASPK